MTTIRGGQVSGDRIEVNASDLIIQSLRDIATYRVARTDRLLPAVY